MGIWSEYKSTLKPLEVEEPIDLALHRPLAFLVAKSAYRTPLTPNQLTLLSMLLGIMGGYVLFASGPGHAFGGDLVLGHIVGGSLLFLSQVVDCSDGMLARMRKSSSELGRMLDGVGDMLTQIAASIGSVAVILRRYPGSSATVAVILLASLTIYTSSFHTAGYDHYKNLFLRMTVPGSHESDDLEEAEQRFAEARKGRMSLVYAFSFQVYLGYLKAQRNMLLWFDADTAMRFVVLPPQTEIGAAVYRRHHAGLMRVWRSLFGVGSLAFGLAVSNAFGRPDLYLLFRLVVLNGAFFFYLMPAQRRASREAFQELGISTRSPTDHPLAA